MPCNKPTTILFNFLALHFPHNCT